jgi:hypothetical protein
MYFPERTCNAADDVVSGDHIGVTVSAMPAEEWSDQAAYIVDTTPSEYEARTDFDAALKAGGLDDAALPGLDGPAACEFWRVYAEQMGMPESEDVALYGGAIEDEGDVESELRGPQQQLTAEYCMDGVWGSLRVISPHAAEPEGQQRLMAAVEQLRGAARDAFSEDLASTA